MSPLSGGTQIDGGNETPFENRSATNDNINNTYTVVPCSWWHSGHVTEAAKPAPWQWLEETEEMVINCGEKRSIFGAIWDKGYSSCFFFYSTVTKYGREWRENRGGDWLRVS